MALLPRESARAQHRSHTRRVCECQLFLRSVLLTLIDIKRLFQRNKLLYYLERSPFTEYVGYSQQHKYLKHDGHEPVANEKMTLGQVVPNFTGQVVGSKILRIFS